MDPSCFKRVAASDTDALEKVVAWIPEIHPKKVQATINTDVLPALRKGKMIKKAAHMCIEKLGNRERGTLGDVLLNKDQDLLAIKIAAVILLMEDATSIYTPLQTLDGKGALQFALCTDGFVFRTMVAQAANQCARKQLLHKTVDYNWHKERSDEVEALRSELDETRHTHQDVLAAQKHVLDHLSSRGALGSDDESDDLSQIITDNATDHAQPSVDPGEDYKTDDDSSDISDSSSESEPSSVFMNGGDEALPGTAGDEALPVIPKFFTGGKSVATRGTDDQSSIPSKANTVDYFESSSEEGNNGKEDDDSYLSGIDEDVGDESMPTGAPDATANVPTRELATNGDVDKPSTKEGLEKTVEGDQSSLENMVDHDTSKLLGNDKVDDKPAGFMSKFKGGISKAKGKFFVGKARGSKTNTVDEPTADGINEDGTKDDTTPTSGSYKESPDAVDKNEAAKDGSKGGLGDRLRNARGSYGKVRSKVSRPSFLTRGAKQETNEKGDVDADASKNTEDDTKAETGTNDAEPKDTKKAPESPTRRRFADRLGGFTKPKVSTPAFLTRNTKAKEGDAITEAAKDDTKQETVEPKGTNKDAEETSTKRGFANRLNIKTGSRGIAKPKVTTPSFLARRFKSKGGTETEKFKPSPSNAENAAKGDTTSGGDESLPKTNEVAGNVDESFAASNDGDEAFPAGEEDPGTEIRAKDEQGSATAMENHSDTSKDDQATTVAKQEDGFGNSGGGDEAVADIFGVKTAKVSKQEDAFRSSGGGDEAIAGDFGETTAKTMDAEEKIQVNEQKIRETHDDPEGKDNEDENSEQSNSLSDDGGTSASGDTDMNKDETDDSDDDDLVDSSDNFNEGNENEVGHSA